ncbi:hypothetical protein [Erwinia pyrifoliae]|uniref:Uncharacterized protein n=1 Tax=Erwinia pyrifoliae TaxID=79967 RepID=A0ABY5X7A6_ERWPY|nr:hypothetical protein [Erwinia pyrifoliae]AUX71567.1 hypothetical protein CPI84_03105 [Erwinia pyrifoliae]MCA8878211.1 hypothetical protein [Erwinia pyrifoliae]MCT2386053.1 hypothetical protein [Erwinia pyrifoliae]MCU8588361.1 hypothetical protein [Erwinia pyrifoliae]UWS29890.1 hypothetical protein NYP81_18950 [Erwinia pyrifoliae]
MEHINGFLAAENGYQLPVEVLSSGRGFYIGTANEQGPVSRESAEYYKTRRQADIALEKRQWTQRKWA